MVLRRTILIEMVLTSRIFKDVKIIITYDKIILLRRTILIENGLDVLPEDVKIILHLSGGHFVFNISYWLDILYSIQVNNC
ncbi:hypothetical protein FRX31_017828 [Thalictrum thalictroides]|uniref:Uncharacterized protein n=1 Tax=Thalictrum thalictroides TaxID=46969 RepID=A0A7J6W5F3_THATH|nr:hypothetical protein FRX31_017828 [Thalictrum thalictroides]